MPLMPKRIKHRKQMRGKMRGNATRGNTVAFGEYGLQTMEASWITARQIEAGRVAATHYLRREGKVYIRIFPDKPVSAKPLETRMGKGKGETANWVAVVKPGRVMFEIGGVPEELARNALRRMASKMPVRCKMVHRRHGL
ncbi:MAG: 50S ribosomal protein L16 [Phycisphaerae bacterium]|nr:50S ribosomal protein L16 [Phycisphaerae bacterium]